MLWSGSVDQPLFSQETVLLIFVGLLLAIIAFLVIKKIYYRFHLYKRYYIVPRMEIAGITNVAMTIALSIAIILILTVLTAGILGIIFRAYPGWRITIEQFLIQLGGLTFGPIIGLFIGGITDLLTVALTSGMFHYGYFVICITYGLLAGLIRSVYMYGHQRIVWFCISSTILLVILDGLFSIFIAFQNYSTFDITLLSFALHFSKLSLIILISSVVGVVILVMWLVLIIFNRKGTKLWFMKAKYQISYKNRIVTLNNELCKTHNSQRRIRNYTKWYSKKMSKMLVLRQKINQVSFQLKNDVSAHRFEKFIMVLIVGTVCQIVCNCFFLPFFDVNFSSFGYDYWLVLRLIIFPILIVLDLLVLFPCFLSVSNLIKYDYSKDIIENLNRPYMEDK